MRSHIRRFLRRWSGFFAIRGWLLYCEASPESFLLEDTNAYSSSGTIPPLFQQFVTSLALPLDEFSAAQQIAFSLSNSHTPGPGVSSSSLHALKAILASEGGVCSDYSQVFAGLCIAAGIRCREWSVCDDILNPSFGHSFNEVYSNAQRKWILIDPYRSIYFSDNSTTTPLSVTELVDRITGQIPANVDSHFIDETRKSIGGAAFERIYFQAENVFTLQLNNQIFQQDRFYIAERFIPLPLLQGLMILCGVYPRFAVYVNLHNQTAMKKKLTRTWHNLSQKLGLKSSNALKRHNRYF